MQDEGAASLNTSQPPPLFRASDRRCCHVGAVGTRGSVVQTGNNKLFVLAIRPRLNSHTAKNIFIFFFLKFLFFKLFSPRSACTHVHRHLRSLKSSTSTQIWERKGE